MATKHKLYRVVIAYEEGIALFVEADNRKQAESKALQAIEEYAGVYESMQESDLADGFDTTHRDYFVADSEKVRDFVTNG